MEVKSSTTKGLYEFGPFRLDPQKRTLLRDGADVPLTPKVFDTLLALVQNSGETISRDELMKAVWPDSFVEESNLTQNIFVLRKALGADRYIVTLPGRGYQFVARVFEIEGNDQASAEESPSAPLARRSLRRSPARAVVMLALLVSAGGIGLLYQGGKTSQSRTRASLMPSATAAVPTRRSLAVLGFRNLSGRPDDQWLSTAFSEMLHTELGAGDQLRMISGEDVARVRLESRLPDADSLAKPSLQRLHTQLGTDLILLGSFTALQEQDKERIRFDVRLQDTESGETIAETAAAGSRNQLFELATQVGEQLRQKLGVGGLSSEQSGEVRASLDANPEATRLYAQGLDALRRFDAQVARDLLEKAVAADPNYALFHSALGESWSALGYDLKARTEAKTALGLSHNLSRKDQLLVEARYRELTHDLPVAAEIYRELWNFFPDDLEYGLRLANVQAQAGRGKDALLSVARLRKLPEPENKDPRIDLAEAAGAESLSNFARDLQAASAAAAKARAQGSRLLLATALREQGYAYQRLGQPDNSIRAFQQAQTLWAAAGDSYGAASALHMIALAQYYRGDFQAARRSFVDALRVFRRIGAQGDVASCSHNLAVMLRDQGKLQEAKDYLQTALRIQRSLHDERGMAADLDDMGNVLLAMGQPLPAARLKEQAVQTLHQVGNRMGEAIALGNLGQVLFYEGRLSAAKEKFEQSLALKQQIGLKQGVGYAWMELAMVLMARDRLVDARALTLQALSLRQQLGDEFHAAESQLQLAQIALEQNQAAEAESLARQAAAAFQQRKSADNSAFAFAVLSRALLAQAKTKEAQAASTQAMALSRQGGDREWRFQALLAAGAVEAASGRTAKAVQLMQALDAEASRTGYVPYQLQARFRLAELQLKSNGKLGRNQLAGVQHDAQAQGFLLIARQAAAAMQGGTAAP